MILLMQKVRTIKKIDIGETFAHTALKRFARPFPTLGLKEDAASWGGAQL